MSMILVCGAECMIHRVWNGGITVSHWGIESIGNSSTPEVVTSPVRSGSKAFYFSSATSGGLSWLAKYASTASQYRYFRGYFRLPNIDPANATAIADLNPDLGAGNFARLMVSTSGVLSFSQKRLSAGVTLNSSTNNRQLAVDTWYGVEIVVHHNTTASSGLAFAWRVWDEDDGWDDYEQVDYSVGESGNSTGRMTVGVVTNAGEANWTVYWDDLAMGIGSSEADAGWDNDTPYSAQVLRYNPSSDGTHNFDSGDFQANFPYAALDPSDTDIYTRLDQDDLALIAADTDSLEGVFQASTSGEYLEVLFSNESSGVLTSSRAVQIDATWDNSGGTSPGDLDVSMDGSSWTTTPNPGNGEGYLVQMLVGSFTQSDINGLRARLYTTGVTAPTGLLGLAAEVEWYEPPVTLTYAVPDADIATTGWVVTPLWSKIDDSPAAPDGTTITGTAS